MTQFVHQELIIDGIPSRLTYDSGTVSICTNALISIKDDAMCDTRSGGCQCYEDWDERACNCEVDEIIADMCPHVLTWQTHPPEGMWYL